MHLAENYGRSLGVKMGNPVFSPHFFPLTSKKKYIVLHNGVKVPAKTYSYWDDVVRLIKPYLDQRDIEIYQIGLQEEPNIEGVNLRLFTNTLKQTAFIIQNSELMVGIDSVPIHIASALDKNSVSIYGHTYMKTCDPLWNKNSRAITIESHRNGNCPSFSLEEHPKTIDMIMPEEIAQGILDQLGIKDKLNHKTIHIGHKYNDKCIDFVPPKHPEPLFNIQLPSQTVYRLDLSHREDFLINALQNQEGQIAIKLSKPVNIEIIKSFKHKIQQLVYEAESFNKDFVRMLTETGLDFILVCNSPKTLQEQRLALFDYEIHYFNNEEFVDEREKAIKSKLDTPKIDFATKKIYMYGNKRMINFLEVKKALGQEVSNRDFFIDSDHMMIYTTN